MPWVNDKTQEDFKNQLLQNGDIIIADAAEDYTVGKVVEITGITDNYAVAGLHTMVARPDEKFSEYFLGFYLNSDSYQKQLIPLMQGVKVLSLNKTNMLKTDIKIPPECSEQSKIAALFSNLDNTITLHQRKLELLKELKQAYLQNLFPENGEKNPRIRFSDFTEDWEQRKLDYFVEDYIEKTVIQNQHPVLTSSQQRGIIFQEEYFANRQVTTENNVGYFVLPRGCFTFRSRTDNGVFRFNRNDIVDKGIISYFYPVFKIQNGSSNFFLKHLNHSIKKEVSLQAEGTGQRVLSLKKFKAIKINVPVIDEQAKIGNLFEIMDETIAFYQRKLESMQNIKKSLLQKMFI